MRRSLTAISIVLAVALIAACSGDRKTTDTGLGSSSTTTSTGPSSDGSTFGDLKSPCGPGEAKGATAQGVPTTQITLGYGDDAGFSVLPGLDHELSDAMKAMIGWCNEQGGINGRKIVGTYYDAKFTEVVNAMYRRLQAGVHAGRSGLGATTSRQEETRLGCKLATVPGFTVAAQVANAPLMVQGVPNPVDVTPGTWAAQLAKLFPDKVKKAAHMFGNVAATIDTKDKAQAAGEAFGWKFLGCPQQYNIAG